MSVRVPIETVSDDLIGDGGGLHEVSYAVSGREVAEPALVLQIPEKTFLNGNAYGTNCEYRAGLYRVLHQRIDTAGVEIRFLPLLHDSAWVHGYRGSVFRTG